MNTAVEKIPKRVYILSRRSLFLQGIETLLADSGDFEIIGQGVKSEDAIECIRKSRPDVVVLNLDDPEPDLSQSIVCFLKEASGIHLVGLSLRDNKICIFRGEDKQALQVEDLFDAILH